MLKFGKKVTIFTIRKETIEKKERTRMKKVEKRNFQSVKTKPGYVRTALPLLLLVVFAIMGLVIVEMIMEKDSYKPGKITGTHYESEMLGISFDAPEGFEMSSQDQIDEQLKSSVSFANVMKSTSGRRMEMAAISEKGTSVSVITWNMEGDDMSAEQYVESSKKTVMQQYETKVKFTNDGEIFSKKIAGETYECLKLDFTSDDTKRCSESYVRMVDGYAVLIGIAYGPENTEERDAVLDAVKAL